jgi:hypothetical protein
MIAALSPLFTGPLMGHGVLLVMTTELPTLNEGDGDVVLIATLVLGNTIDSRDTSTSILWFVVALTWKWIQLQLYLVLLQKFK